MRIEQFLYITIVLNNMEFLAVSATAEIFVILSAIAVWSVRAMTAVSGEYGNNFLFVFTPRLVSLMSQLCTKLSIHSVTLLQFLPPSSV